MQYYDDKIHELRERKTWVLNRIETYKKNGNTEPANELKKLIPEINKRIRQLRVTRQRETFKYAPENDLMSVAMETLSMTDNERKNYINALNSNSLMIKEGNGNYRKVELTPEEKERLRNFMIFSMKKGYKQSVTITASQLENVPYDEREKLAKIIVRKRWHAKKIQNRQKRRNRIKALRSQASWG